MDFKIDTDVF